MGTSPLTFVGLTFSVYQVTGVPIVFVSALEGKGRAAIMRHVNESYRLWCVRLPTAKLNRWLRKVCKRIMPCTDKNFPWLLDHDFVFQGVVKLL
jgi:predicted GTPase